MRRSKLSRGLVAFLMVTSGVLIACGRDAGFSPTDRLTGATDFVSADASQGQDAGRSDGLLGDANAAPEAGGAADSEARTVEEGDIYRVMAGNRIVNLNAYRGLQIIDFTDVSDPAVIGRLQIAGYPVELYVIDNTVYVLMNNWYGYYDYAGLLRDAGDGTTLEQWYGGVVVAIDITDPTAPQVINRARIPGNISRSRVARGSTSSSLYVVTGGYADWGDGNWASRTVVKSFDISNRALVARTELNLGGYVTDIQGSSGALIVARQDWQWGGGSLVSLIDISNTDGTMVEGAEVQVAGYVESQFNMDLDNGILRVVSGASWSGSRTNHLQTYEATNIQSITPVDHKTFGAGEQLYATLFRGNKAFFVTYLRVDPFHAFQIDATGIATEMTQFVVSGWNDFFRAVEGDTRLVGIGIDDQNTRTLSVSLYDITDLTNPNPLLARANVEADYSWSEANWDHRAFSVLENVVNATGPNGEAETGLVLLPFSGWNSGANSYTAAVQIFTFSPTSLTRRDLMVHGTPVRRSFQAATDTTANLSEAELSLFDTRDVDAAAELGRLELAPNYTDYLSYGSHAARVKNSRDYYSYWWGSQADLPPAKVDIISATPHPDLAEPVASIEVPSDARTYKSGDQLVSVATRIADSSQWPYTYDSRLDVYDLGNPAAPRFAGSTTSDRLRPAYDSWYWGYGDMVGDCFDCGGWWGGYDDARSVEAVPGALAFLQRHPQQELVGVEHSCNTWPVYDGSCYSNGWADGCNYYSGNINCRSLNGAPEVCYGTIQLCNYNINGPWECVDIDESTIATQTSCWDYDRYRYWQSFSLEVLDLTSATGPTFAPSIELPLEDEGVSMLADGSDIWITYRKPEQLAGDARPYVRYFIKRVDLSHPGQPVIHAAINVPGELIAKEGSTILTQDVIWGQNIAETALAKLSLRDGLAYLQGSHTFTDQWVQEVRLDGAGNALVSHRLMWGIDGVDPDYRQHLALLGTTGSSLTLVSDTAVADWATPREARAGRALFQVSGGVLVFNLDDPTAPYAQAYFPTRGWPQRTLLDGRNIILPAGRYGMYRFDLDTYNLLTPEL